MIRSSDFFALLTQTFYFSNEGDTMNIPDSIMGLTFLAAGTSVPEAVSSVIVTSQGHGAMGISSSISSNTFDILLCLGLPWFIKSYFYPNSPGENWVRFQIEWRWLPDACVHCFSSCIHRSRLTQPDCPIRLHHYCPHCSACMWRLYWTNSAWTGK